MKIPVDLKYTENDEWVKIEGSSATIGISDYAQDHLSDIVFVEFLLSEGDEESKGETFSTVESVKAAADVFLPVSGKVIAVNEALVDAPEKLNKDPYGDAWMMKVELSDASELDDLMDAKAYEAYCQEREG